MMKIFKIVLLVLLLTGIHAKAAKWKKLKPLDAYKGTAYNLKENVAYMEIRWYASKKSKKVNKTLVLYRKSLKSYPADVIAKFEALRPKYSTKADIGAAGNAFFIDVNGKMFQMDMRRDVVSLLDKIDTPAEVQLILNFGHEEYGKFYKKTAKGYKVKTSEPLGGCTSISRVQRIDKAGNFSNDRASSTLLRKGCKKRKHTRFVSNKKISYEYYSAIDIDKKGNLYVLGAVKKNKDFNGLTFSVLEKYGANGKRLWSKKFKDYTSNIAVVDKSIYLFEDKKLTAKYTLNGKKKSSNNASEFVIDKKGNISIYGKKVEQRVINDKKYFPEGLPNKKEAIDFQAYDYIKDQSGNVFIVGSEVFYPSGSPDEVPSGQCGMVEQVHGALIAKLNSKGKTVWAKVIDRND